jgi:hypothetical protein
MGPKLLTLSCRYTTAAAPRSGGREIRARFQKLKKYITGLSPREQFQIMETSYQTPTSTGPTNAWR